MSALGVLVIAKAVPPVIGGIEAYSAELVDAYASKGFSASLVTPEGGSVITSTARVDRTSGTPVPGPQWRALLGVLTVLWKLRGRRWRWIHATSWRMAVPALMLRVKGRLVVTVHGREVTEQRGPMRWLASLVLGRADLLVFVSEATRKDVLGHLPALQRVTSVVAWNGTSTGLNSDAQGGVSSKDDGGLVHILTVCRLVKRKNLPFAVAVIARLQQRFGDGLRYTIAGDGPERASILKAISEQGLRASCIDVAGRVSEARLHEMYRRADVFFHPQSSAHDPKDIEGFGLSIIDAMACGVPVVCGKDGGPSEYICNGDNGYLVSGVNEDEAVNYLHELASDRCLRSKIGEAGRRLVVQSMTWERHVSSIVDVMSLA